MGVAAQVEIENSFSNLQTKLSAFSRPPYVPPPGQSLDDIAAAWDHLTQAEAAKYAFLGLRMEDGAAFEARLQGASFALLRCPCNRSLTHLTLPPPCRFPLPPYPTPPSPSPSPSPRPHPAPACPGPLGTRTCGKACARSATTCATRLRTRPTTLPRGSATGTPRSRPSPASSRSRSPRWVFRRSRLPSARRREGKGLTTGR